MGLDTSEHNQTAIITSRPISSLIELKQHGSKSLNAAFYQPVHMYYYRRTLEFAGMKRGLAMGWSWGFSVFVGVIGPFGTGHNSQGPFLSWRPAQLSTSKLVVGDEVGVGAWKWWG